MAKAKSKNDIKVTSTKKNNTASKRGTKATADTKKARAPKKKLEIVDEVKKGIVEETELVKKPTKKKTSVPKKTDTVSLTQEEIIAQRKERNRRKYQNQQKKYQDAKKSTTPKKKIEVEDTVEVEIKKSDTVNEEDLVKKVKEKELDEVNKEQERKEKRKENHKSIHFTQTITDIKEKSVTRIYYVKEKTNDKNIPVGKTKEEKVKRSRRLIKESIVYSIILTIIDVACILIFDDFNFLRLFDVKALNIVLTILIALVFNFFVAFMIDYFVTIAWLKIKRKKEVGEQNGDNRVNEEEYREDIENKEGE